MVVRYKVSDLIIFTVVCVCLSVVIAAVESISGNKNFLMYVPILLMAFLTVAVEYAKILKLRECESNWHKISLTASTEKKLGRYARLVFSLNGESVRTKWMYSKNISWLDEYTVDVYYEGDCYVVDFTEAVRRKL